MSRAPRDTERRHNTSIYSKHNQLGGIPAQKLPYGLPRLHVHEEVELNPWETGTRSPQGVDGYLDGTPPMWQLDREEGRGGSKKDF